MDESVWSFAKVTLRQRRYLVLLVRWSDFDEPVSTALERHSKKFGQFMEDRGAILMPYREKMRSAFFEVFNKSWPPAVRERMQGTQFPFLVVIDKDFEPFDPRTDPSAIVWFADFEEKPEDIWKVLDAVARRIRNDDDIFAYLREVEGKARQAQLAGRAAQGLDKYVDVTIPVVPGFISIKANAILADIAKLLQ